MSARESAETYVLPADEIAWEIPGGAPAGSVEQATLYGDLDAPGPYLVLMRWYPGFFSNPHAYVTDRVCVVVSGTWWVNSGDDFDPAHATPVTTGGYVLRHANTPHYDGVPTDGTEPAVIAISGLGPVQQHFIHPGSPLARPAQ